MVEGGKVLRWAIIALIVIVLALVIYFIWYYYPKCEDMSCYVAHQEKCKKNRFVNDGPEKTWVYRVLGKEESNCNIEVTLLHVKQGDVKMKVLENKKMICSLLYGSKRNPEIDLTKCHGELREEIQNQLIQKLHTYIVESVGEIGEELRKI